jgi:hypothetical protein
MMEVKKRCIKSDSNSDKPFIDVFQFLGPNNENFLLLLLRLYVLV